MTMYIELLSLVFMTNETDAVAPMELLVLALERRDRMLNSAAKVGWSAERNLAYDVDYDSALIKLCMAVGIDAEPTSFGQPREERTRLEHALAEAGVDLRRFTDQRTFDRG